MPVFRRKREGGRGQGNVDNKRGAGIWWWRE
jgi:hypothetical protein